MNKEKLKQDVTIDPDDLDVECCRQADIFFEYAEMYVVAKTKSDRLKREYSSEEARLQLDVRRNPEKYSLDKPTDASIKAVVLTLQSLKELSVGLQEAETETDMTFQATQAMDQKKRSLDNLVKLHGQNYFAGPKVPHDLSEAWRNRREKSEDRVNERALQNRRATPKRN